MNTTIALLGAGGHAKVILDALLLVFSEKNISVFDENSNKLGAAILGLTVCVPIPDYAHLPNDVHVAIGNNIARRRLGMAMLNANKHYVSVVHPQSVVSKLAKIGKGVFVGAGAVIAPDAVLADGIIINHNSVIDHDCNIGSWTHIAPGAVLGGGVSIGDNCLIGAGAVVLPGIQIADNAVIGAGAVVTKDVSQGAIVLGVPARKIGIDK